MLHLISLLVSLTAFAQLDCNVSYSVSEEAGVSVIKGSHLGKEFSYNDKEGVALLLLTVGDISKSNNLKTTRTTGLVKDPLKVTRTQMRDLSKAMDSFAKHNSSLDGLSKGLGSSMTKIVEKFKVVDDKIPLELWRELNEILLFMREETSVVSVSENLLASSSEHKGKSHPGCNHDSQHAFCDTDAGTDAWHPLRREGLCSLIETEQGEDQYPDTRCKTGYTFERKNEGGSAPKKTLDSKAQAT